MIDKEYITVNEAAELMGVVPRTIYNKVWSGELRAYKLGPRSIRIKQEDLWDLLEPISPLEYADYLPDIDDE